MSIGWGASPLATQVEEYGAFLRIPVLAVHPVTLFEGKQVLVISVEVIDVVHKRVL